MTSRYQLATSSWDNKELEAIQKVIDSDMFSMSEYVTQFEREFCTFSKSKYAVMDFTDNIAKLEIECKNREGNKHNDFDGDCDTNGLCFGRNKYYYAIERLKLGYKFIVYFNCSDGIFYWELTNSEKQKDEYTFGMGGNKKIGQRPTQLIYIKTKYLQKFQQ